MTEDSAETPVRRGTPLRKEFLVAITNPTALLIFTAFVPRFVDPARDPIPVRLDQGTAAVLPGMPATSRT